MTDPDPPLRPRPVLTRRWAVAGPVRDVDPEDVAALGAFLAEAFRPPFPLPYLVTGPEPGRYLVRWWTWRV